MPSTIAVAAGDITDFATPAPAFQGGPVRRGRGRGRGD